MAKNSLLDFANLAANLQQSSNISRISKDSAVSKKDSAAAKAASTEALAKVDELLKKEHEREAREKLERERAELHSRRQKEIKDVVFELKQELDDLEKQGDRVARVVILSLLQSEIENMDILLDEFESLLDREYANEALDRLDDMGAETESALTDTERKQLADLDSALELVGKKAEHVLEIEGGIKELESPLAELARKINQQEEDLAQRAKRGKDKRDAGFGGIVTALFVSLICVKLDWNTAAALASAFFGGIGSLFLLTWILGIPGRRLHRNSTMKSLREDRKQRDEINAELQDRRSKLAMAVDVEDQEQAKQTLLTIVKDHPELGFLVETNS